MGGDHGPKATVAGAAECLRRFSGDVRFQLYGNRAEIDPILAKHKKLQDAATIFHTDKVVSGDEKPSQALRSGKGSSMQLAIEAVANGEADAIISSGNTGALMAMAKLGLRTLPDIRRPAIASVFPCENGETIMLDLGANTICDSDNLVQFALLGAVFAKSVKGVNRPTVGLLNVGTEEMKGNDQIRVASDILRTMEHFPGVYYGYIEGNDIPAGTVNVVVTDGFTGNIALKVAEGTAEFVGQLVRNALKSSPMAMLGALFARPALHKMRTRVDPRFYNGGMFLGLNGICVKSHGRSDAYAFSRALLNAATMVQNNYNQKVAAELAALTEPGS